MQDIYQKYARLVYKYLLSKVNDEDLAEELTQETFYRALKNIQTFNNSSKLSTWLCGIANRVHLEYLRKHPDYLELDEIEDSTKSAEEEAISNITEMRLLKALHSFPEPGREIMYLRIFGNLSFKEIGEILGQNENWARVNYYRSKEKLRKEIQDEKL